MDYNQSLQNSFRSDELNHRHEGPPPLIGTPASCVAERPGPWDAGSWESLIQRCRSPCMRFAMPVVNTRRTFSGSKPASSKASGGLERGFYVYRLNREVRKCALRPPCEPALARLASGAGPSRPPVGFGND